MEFWVSDNKEHREKYCQPHFLLMKNDISTSHSWLHSSNYPTQNTILPVSIHSNSIEPWKCTIPMYNVVPEGTREFLTVSQLQDTKTIASLIYHQTILILWEIPFIFRPVITQKSEILTIEWCIFLGWPFVVLMTEIKKLPISKLTVIRLLSIVIKQLT